MAAELESVLRRLVSEHEGLLVLTLEHRRCLAQAELTALNSCIGRQAEAVQRIAALERERQAIVARFLPPPTTASTLARPGTPAAAPPTATVSTLAAAAPEPVRSRLLSIAQSLRELLNRLHREHVALRAAAETLSGHMEGLMRQVCRTLSHAGTYGRCGSFESRVQVVSAIDVKT